MFSSVRRKKKSRKKRVDEVAEFMNQSVDSAHSATDANILDERPLRSMVSIYSIWRSFF